MWIFLKTQISSLLATLMDFLTTIFLVEVAKLHYVEATVIGAIAGAFTNFFLNKYWSFESGSSGLKHQGLRYFLVWIGSVLLNTLGIYILTGSTGLSYIVSKIIVAIVVGIAFNYTLQRHYVFAKHEKIFSK
jgi:putative flippase GtrA